MCDVCVCVCWPCLFSVVEDLDQNVLDKLSGLQWNPPTSPPANGPHLTWQSYPRVGDPCSPSRYVGPIEFAKQPSPALHPASPGRFAKVVCSGAVEESLLEPDLELRLPSYLFFSPPNSAYIVR